MEGRYPLGQGLQALSRRLGTHRSALIDHRSPRELDQSCHAAPRTSFREAGSAPGGSLVSILPGAGLPVSGLPVQMHDSQDLYSFRLGAVYDPVGETVNPAPADVVFESRV